jgi:ABC-type phosphate/phosphonate transport system substrate-binding protein
VPTHVVVAAAGLKPQDQTALRAAFLNLNETAHTDLRDRIFTDAFVEVDSRQHLLPVREALGLVEERP